MGDYWYLDPERFGVCNKNPKPTQTLRPPRSFQGTLIDQRNRYPPFPKWGLYVRRTVLGCLDQGSLPFNWASVPTHFASRNPASTLSPKEISARDRGRRSHRTGPETPFQGIWVLGVEGCTFTVYVLRP